MSKEGISTMIGATNSVILKELIKEKDQKLAALQFKVEQLEKLVREMLDDHKLDKSGHYKMRLNKILRQR